MGTKISRFEVGVGTRYALLGFGYSWQVERTQFGLGLGIAAPYLTAALSYAPVAVAIGPQHVLTLNTEVGWGGNDLHVFDEYIVKYRGPYGHLVVDLTKFLDVAVWGLQVGGGQTWRLGGDGPEWVWSYQVGVSIGTLGSK